LRTIACALAAAALLLGPSTALAHQGNPHYRSVVQSITPATKGVSVTVLDYDDRLALHNTSGKDVLILDYQNKPYARVLANGTVQVNTNSEAYYLNQDRLGTITVPKGLGSSPAWKLESRSGRFEWHDHRSHWMGTSDPPQLKDKSRRTFIDDWSVPIEIGGAKGQIAGTLTWVPITSSPLPLGAIFAFAALLIVLSIAVFVVRRRRADAAGEPGGESGEAPREAPVEAW
jgi:hypothetical protein